MSERLRNMETLRRFGVAWAERNINELLELVTDNCVYSASIGPEPGKTFVGRRAVAEGFDWMLQAEMSAGMVSEPGRICVWDDRTGYAEWASITTDGVRIRGVDIVEFEGGKIAKKDAFRKVVS
jgi:ketosteroid isomerase-like protein